MHLGIDAGASRTVRDGCGRRCGTPGGGEMRRVDGAGKLHAGSGKVASCARLRERSPRPRRHPSRRRGRRSGRGGRRSGGPSDDLAGRAPGSPRPAAAPPRPDPPLAVSSAPDDPEAPMGTVGVVRSDGPGQRIHDVADPASGQLNSFPVPGTLSASTRASPHPPARLRRDGVDLRHGVAPPLAAGAVSGEPEGVGGRVRGNLGRGAGQRPGLVASAGDVPDGVHVGHQPELPGRRTGREAGQPDGPDLALLGHDPEPSSSTSARCAPRSRSRWRPSTSSTSPSSTAADSWTRGSSGGPG